MAKIFISYRRHDSPAVAARLGDSLSRLLGTENVFRDIDAMDPGVSFPDALEAAIRGSDALLVVIGPRWLIDEDGQPAFAPADDWVRREILLAFASGRTVVPVLVDGAELPASESVPEDVRRLLQAQAIRLDDEGWDDDVARLVAGLGFTTLAQRRRRAFVWLVAVAGVLAVVLGGSAIAFLPDGTTTTTDGGIAIETTTTLEETTTTGAETTTTPPPQETTTTTDPGCTPISARSLPVEAINVDAVNGDFDGDGNTDDLFAYNVSASPNISRFMVQLHTGYTHEFVDELFTQILPPEFIGTLDINGDGMEEAFVRYAGGASTSTLRVLTFADCRMATLGEFLIGGSVGAGSGLECPRDGETDLVDYAAAFNGTDGYIVSWQRYRIAGDELELVDEEPGVEVPFEHPLEGLAYSLTCGNLEM